MAYTAKATALRRCHATTKAGEPCRNYALLDGSGVCLSHSSRQNHGPHRRHPWPRAQPPAAAPPCMCPAYAWPHRRGGGLCRWPDPPAQCSPILPGTRSPLGDLHHNTRRYRRLFQSWRWGPDGIYNGAYHKRADTRAGDSSMKKGDKQPMSTNDGTTTNGYQAAASYYQQAAAEAAAVAQYAQQLAALQPGTDSSTILTRWRERAWEQTRREVGEQKMQATDVYQRMAALAQSELTAASAQQGARAPQQQQQPTDAAQFQARFFDRHGRWPTIEEQKQAGVQHP